MILNRSHVSPTRDGFMTPITLPFAPPAPGPAAPAPATRETPASQGIGPLVLQLARRRVAPDSFVARRTRAAVESLPDPVEARLAAGVADHFTGEARDLPEGLTALLSWAGHLEARGSLASATRILEVARELSPLDPELALHAARVARKARNFARARALYRDVERLDDGTGRLARLSRVGRAMIAPDADARLGRVLREAVEGGDGESAGVALEARALARRARGDAAGALRDLMAAAVRFEDPADSGRLGHQAADLLVGAGLHAEARRMLEVVAEKSLPEQARWARARLYDLARLQGDQVGSRRFRDDRQAGLVSLVPGRVGARCAGPGRSGQEERVARLAHTAHRVLERLEA